MVGAADTLLALDRRCRIEGVHVLEETRVLGLEPTADPIAVDTDRGRLLAERVVVTAGAWVGELLPSLREHLQVKRQTVGYFDLGDTAEAARPGRFPVWVYLGNADTGLYYGLPEFGREGIKAALHGSGGGGDDPDRDPGPDLLELASTRRFLEWQLVGTLGETLHAETCLYTNTPDEHFVIGPVPGAPRVLVGSICSGHGFKFGPLMGRILAGLAIDGTSGVPEFEAARSGFAPPA